MRVLVTRPDPGGERTAARLALLGHEAVRMPLFETEITASPADLPPPDRILGLIATSARAFDVFNAEDPADSAIFSVPVHAVGPATAQAAHAAGFADVREGGGAARDLARALTGAASPPTGAPGTAGAEDEGRGLVYLAGAPRTAVIEEALRDAGLAFSVLDCYRMVEISYSTDSEIEVLFDPQLEVVLLYSANAADRLVELVTAKNLGKSLHSTRFLCLSPDIRDRLPEPWRTRASAAGRPDEDSLLASLTALG